MSDTIRLPHFDEDMLVTFEPFLEKLPQSLSQIVALYLQEFNDLVDQSSIDFEFSKETMAQLIHVWGCSDFVASLCIHKPLLLKSLIESNDLFSKYESGTYYHRLQLALDNVTDSEALHRILRQFRNREMLRIIWRDVNKLAQYADTVNDLTELADACVQLTLDVLQHWLVEECGQPMGADKNPQLLHVIAVGKLGGKELNLSSDIDLIFAYPESGETVGGPKTIVNEVFFMQLAQQFIQALNQLTADGFVFRVDMRLRPFGTSGPIVMSFNALRDYYLESGRDWERYALVKARIITGEAASKEKLKHIIKRFVYRHYIDFSAINALRDMKKLLQKEAQAKGLEDNIKRGSGGIREIEFMSQVFQLIRGGSDIAMQEQNMLMILRLLGDNRYLRSKVVKLLGDAYLFLRNTEHCLQAIHDRQTQMLPKDEIDQTRLAYAMQFSNWPAFLEKLNDYRKRVKKHFSQIIEQPKSSDVIDEKVAQQSDLQLVWLSAISSEYTAEILQAYGLQNAKDIMSKMMLIRDSEAYQKLSTNRRIKLDSLVPLCIGSVQEITNADLTLTRILKIVEAILPKFDYIKLLLENSTALEQLTALCNASPWIADQIASYPALINDLVNLQALYAPLPEQTLSAELRQYLVAIPQHDLEQQMDGLRRFKHTHVLRVAAADIMNLLPLMKVSDHLTFTASVILREVQDMALQEMIDAYGHPVNEAGESIDLEFMIIGYGKLGGIELSYGSDLDLVFLHGEIEQHWQTSGEQSISLQVFYTRLGQKIVQLLNKRTSEGLLYEVDTRLRPQGSSGLLVNSFAAFENYQLNEAWTWEHQALVRAQAITGSEQIKARFKQIRSTILSKAREQTKLREEVISMRDKMRVASLKKIDEKFDVKQGRGGMTDIEFIAQYAVLRYAKDYPTLMIYSDNIRIFENCCDVNLLTSEQCELLCAAYKGLRAVVHQNDLQKAEALASDEDYLEWREGVQAIWQQLLID